LVAESPRRRRASGDRHVGFNGAATNWSRRAPPGWGRPRRSQRGFNGAATNWSRRDLAAPRGPAAPLRLQWGRDQLVAESSTEKCGCRVLELASMGPRPIGRGERTVGLRSRRGRRRLQWGRDQLVAERPPHRSARCRRHPRFNGAATNWSRRAPPWSPRPDPRCPASMGPRPIGRGECMDCSTPAPHRRYRFNGAATNWSRRVGAILSLGQQPVASMGPRPIGRGELGSPACGARSATQASMGPRPIGRGETAEHDVLLRRIVTLQWGRDQLVAERPMMPVALHEAPQASMGPRPIGRGES